MFDVTVLYFDHGEQKFSSVMARNYGYAARYKMSRAQGGKFPQVIVGLHSTEVSVRDSKQKLERVL